MNPLPSPTAAGVPPPAPQARELTRATRQFEAILLKRMLASLEKTTSLTPQLVLGGGGQYGSMMVEALADAIAEAGGLGLAKTLEGALPPPAPRPTGK